MCIKAHQVKISLQKNPGEQKIKHKFSWTKAYMYKRPYVQMPMHIKSHKEKFDCTNIFGAKTQRSVLLFSDTPSFHDSFHERYIPRKLLQASNLPPPFNFYESPSVLWS